MSIESTVMVKNQVVTVDHVEKSVLKINDKGTTQRIAVGVDHDDVEIRIYLDGKMLPRKGLFARGYLQASSLEFFGFTNSTPGIQLLYHIADGTSWFAITLPLSFERSLDIRAHQITGENQNVDVGVTYTKVKREPDIQQPKEKPWWQWW